ncbi:hypothetical protein AYI86_03310 [Shewanella algae]|nr:hypothetical protein AYI86_03310 [Shewanella algae]
MPGDDLLTQTDCIATANLPRPGNFSLSKRLLSKTVLYSLTFCTCLRQEVDQEGEATARAATGKVGPVRTLDS